MVIFFPPLFFYNGFRKYKKDIKLKIKKKILNWNYNSSFFYNYKYRLFFGLCIIISIVFFYDKSYKYHLCGNYQFV